MLHNINKKLQIPLHDRLFGLWRWGDSNPRPLTCEALTADVSRGASEGGAKQPTARCGIWSVMPVDRREGCKGRSDGGIGGPEVFVADVRALPARVREKPSKKALRLCCVWLELSRGRCRGAGDSAARSVGAHKRATAGEDLAQDAGRALRVRTTKIRS
jgi:hypothetical protein